MGTENGKKRINICLSKRLIIIIAVLFFGFFSTLLFSSICCCVSWFYFIIYCSGCAVVFQSKKWVLRPLIKGCATIALVNRNCPNVRFKIPPHKVCQKWNRCFCQPWWQPYFMVVFLRTNRPPLESEGSKCQQQHSVCQSKGRKNHNFLLAFMTRADYQRRRIYFYLVQTKWLSTRWRWCSSKRLKRDHKDFLWRHTCVNYCVFIQFRSA